MSSLNDFISQVKQGMAVSSHFLVQLNLPPALTNIQSVDMQKVILFCDQAQLPGISFGTNPVRSYGEVREVPYEKLYEGVNLSFYVDANMTVKLLFDEWIALIQNPVTRDFNFPQRYLTDTIKIIVKNTQGESVYLCTLHECYPKAVAPIQLDYSAKDVMKMNVSITYKYATTKQLSKTTSLNTENSQIDTIMEEYNYGFESLAEIPNNYFNDFSGFQNQLKDFDLSFGDAKSIASFENIGVKTGFGGLFG
jgi:hypothetical protein